MRFVRSFWRTACPVVMAGSALAAGVLVAAPASAAPVTFSGSGVVVPGAGFNPFASPWPLVATSTGGYTVNGDAGWNFLSEFRVDLLFTPAPVPTGGSGTFALTDSDSSDALYGTVLTTATPTGFDIAYTVTSGAGAYANFSGTGSSSVIFTSDPSQLPVSYREVNGTIPEPTTAALVLAALVAGIGRRVSRPSRRWP